MSDLIERLEHRLKAEIVVPGDLRIDLEDAIAALRAQQTQPIETAPRTDDKRVAEILQDIRGGQRVHINPTGATLLEAYISGLQASLDATTARLREAEGLVGLLNFWTRGCLKAFPGWSPDQAQAAEETCNAADAFLKGANNG